MNYISVNWFVPVCNISEHEYYRGEYGEDHDFPEECWTVYVPSNMDGMEEIVDYLRVGGNLSWGSTPFAVTLYDCSGVPVARLKKPGAVLGQADSTDQVLISQVAEIYSQLLEI